MTDKFLLAVNRDTQLSVTQQIFRGMRDAILKGTLKQGSRLSSWQDLAAQLGVSRGTVKRAYDLLRDENLIETKGRAGTWVSTALPVSPALQHPGPTEPAGLFYDFDVGPQYFQLGVPAYDEFPTKPWHTAWRRAIAAEATRPQIYPDPRGISSLRLEVAGYLATARGIRCHPDQVFITSGFAGALGIVLNTMEFRGQAAYVEEPGFPRTRQALEQSGITTIAVPVDRDGIGLPRSTGAVRLAVVTPGQQAPLGMTLSSDRRSGLLRWAADADGWIIEDDYAGELQLSGHAAPSLASEDSDGRVFYIGSFSKTLSPGLRLGFLVVPPSLTARFGRFVGHLAPAGPVVAQRAVQNFMSGGHFLRHLRRMKALYAERKSILVEALRQELHPAVRCEFEGALSVRLFLPPIANDVAIATSAQREGLGVLPISAWYQGRNPPQGLLLGVANVRARTVSAKCEMLARILAS